MLSCLNQINLIRYLIVWRVNSSLVFFPRFQAIDFSDVLGSIICQRLPTSEKKQWTKALTPLKNIIEQIKNKKLHATDLKFPDSSWPLKTTIFVYPNKRTFGKDELIFWELKLFGDDADHGLFLEVLLPAMEEACVTANPEWNSRNRLWGHFDILNIYAARGSSWQPFVSNGKLDLTCRVNPQQWLQDLQLQPKVYHPLKYVDWILPADFTDDLAGYYALALPDEKQKLKFKQAPPLSLILFSLIQRISRLLYEPKKRSTKIEDVLKTDDQEAFWQAIRGTLQINIAEKKLHRVPRSWPGKFCGAQKYSSIPEAIIPYLNIASILHVGRFTHFGCGTFVLR